MRAHPSRSGPASPPASGRGAFDVAPDGAMWLDPEERVRIW